MTGDLVLRHFSLDDERDLHPYPLSRGAIRSRIDPDEWRPALDRSIPGAGDGPYYLEGSPLADVGAWQSLLITRESIAFAGGLVGLGAGAILAGSDSDLSSEPVTLTLRPAAEPCWAETGTEAVTSSIGTLLASAHS